MPIDPEGIRSHYASLTDDALLLVERADLTPTAQKIFDAEILRRGLEVETAKVEADKRFDENPFDSDDFDDGDGGDDPDWLENAFPVTMFSDTPSGIADAEDSRKALHAANIPCEVTEEEIDPSEEPAGAPYRQYRVMVPNALSLQAASILDTAVFNPRLEADWKTQFESLTTEELQALNVDMLCAGLLDRAERLRKAYKGEMARRMKAAQG